MLTRAPSKVSSRAMIPLNSRFTTSLTRSIRCFIVSLKRCCGHENLRFNALTFNGSEFLRDSLKLIALDYVAYLIFAEITKFDSPFHPGAHFFVAFVER